MTDRDSKALLDDRRRTLDELLQERRFGPEYHALQDEVLQLERAVADERGEPHAVEWALGETWNGMAYAPVVLGDAVRCAIVFATRTCAQAVLAFHAVTAYKLTSVSEEIIEGHPLSGKGLIAYRSFVVKHSSWIAELSAIDRVHPQHDAQRWRTVQHYLLCFKDRMFEAIARGAQLLGTFGSVDEALQRATAHVTSRTQMP